MQIVGPTIFKPILEDHLSVACEYVNVLLPDTSIPAPSVCDECVALLANNIVWSLISNTEELIIVLLPSTWRLPLIITIPVLSPCADGSIIKVEGTFKLPEIVKDSNAPIDVILGWAGVAIIPLILPQTSRFWLNDTSPTTCNNADGSVVPIPNLPSLVNTDFSILLTLNDIFCPVDVLRIVAPSFCCARAKSVVVFLSIWAIVAKSSVPLYPIAALPK